MPAQEHHLKRQYPAAWAWAFEGLNPAFVRLTQDKLARELTIRTRYPWTTASINHIVRGLDRPLTGATPSRDDELTDAPVDELAPEVVPEPELTPEEAVEQKVTVAQQVLRLRAEQNYLKQLSQEEARRRAVIQAITEGAALLPPPQPYVRPPSLRSSETPHMLLLQWSDLHAGKRVDDDEVGAGGQFHFDRFTLEEGVQHWLRGIRRFLEIYRNAFPVPRIAIASLGDMVNGSDMRPHNKLEVDRLIGTIGRQTTYVGRLIAEVIRELSAECEELFFIGMGGNHGRVGKFGDNTYLDNFDWLAYHFAQAHCSGMQNVRFYIPDSPTSLVRFGNKLFHFQHGDAIRSWGESPANAVKRAVRKDAFTLGVTPDYSMMGHFHQAISFQAGGKLRVYMNGNQDGGDHYCVDCLKEACEPSQNLFLVHPRRGIVAHHEIALRSEGQAVAVPFEFEAIGAA